jgi:uncharacterized protein (TIGR03000 family)
MSHPTIPLGRALLAAGALLATAAGAAWAQPGMGRYVGPMPIGGYPPSYYPGAYQRVPGYTYQGYPWFRPYFPDLGSGGEFEYDLGADSTANRTQGTPGGVTYDSGYRGSSRSLAPRPPAPPLPGSAAPDRSSSFYPPASAATTDDTAHVTVRVPARARLWFDGAATTSTGPVREFQSPALEPGQWYGYVLRAVWEENGKEVSQTQRVSVTAGSRVRVDFPAPAGTTAAP